MKRGTVVLVRVLWPDTPDQRAVIVRRGHADGWYIVRFDDGDRLCVHESLFAQP